MKQLIKSIEYKTLLRVYAEVVKNLNEVYKDENDVSPEERIFLNMFSTYSKLKPYRNMWIGRRNIDFIFPQFKLKLEDKTYLGIAIEINGGIHNSEFKMKKDYSKDTALLEASIFPISIDTENLTYGHLLGVFNEIIHNPRNDSRGRKRVLKNIYIKTILANRTNAQLFSLFNYQNAKYLILLRGKFNAWCGEQRMNHLLRTGDNNGK